jgi:AcrR family transcriptional regulator
MPQIKEINLDPRSRRTRELLQQALSTLLDTREFDTISVQDITESATINRATFYAHYSDKFALLECVIATRFNQFLASRSVQFDTTCETALANIILAVSDYLIDLCEKNTEKQIQPHIELAIITVVKRMLLAGFKKHAADKPIAKSVSPEMIAATVSWAIYGAVKEWTQTPNRSSVEELVNSVVMLVTPIFESSVAH